MKRFKKNKEPRHSTQKFSKKVATDYQFSDLTVLQNFENWQSELDCRHDKHERIVKLSRDITIESKRTIFLLHRISK